MSFLRAALKKGENKEQNREKEKEALCNEKSMPGKQFFIITYQVLQWRTRFFYKKPVYKKPTCRIFKN